MANKRARALRHNMTDAEKRLWQPLRELKGLGFRFRSQVPIDPYIVDFACYGARLVIEVDGGQHNMEPRLAAVIKRDAFLNQQGFKVLRFWNNDVLQNTEGVMTVILNELEKDKEI